LVDIINTAPYFTVTSFPVFNSTFNSISSLKIVEVADDESNPITFSAKLFVSGVP
jgi:hypothetical protein